jgi:hypothetical protein
MIFELNKNDNFTSEITIFISLSLYFAPFRCRRHMKTSSLKRNNVYRFKNMAPPTHDNKIIKMFTLKYYFS